MAFCLRAASLGPEEIPLRFTAGQLHQLTAYQAYLSTDFSGSEVDVDLFQDTLSTILFRCERQEIDLLGKLACPVQSFMAILALRSVGKFVGARLVTQPISRLMYLSRGAVLLLALEQAPKMEDTRFMV